MESTYAAFDIYKFNIRNTIHAGKWVELAMISMCILHTNFVVYCNKAMQK